MKLYVTIAGALTLALAAASIAFAQPGGGGIGAVRQACQADITKFCPDAKPGPGGGMRECIRGHFADLSDGCKQALMAMRAARQSQGGGATNAAH